jgi:hypothetical protein
MPVTLAELKRNVRTIPVLYQGLTLTISYRPSQVTPMLGREMSEDSKSPTVIALLRTLVSWDIYEDDEMTVMLPITEDVLSGPGIGSGLLNAMLQAITVDTLAGKA